MNRSRLAPALLLISFFLTSTLQAADAPAPSAADARRKVMTEVATRPLHFEPNQGQAHPGVRFVARGQGYLLTLSPLRATLGLYERPSSSALRNAKSREDRMGTMHIVQMELLRGNRKATAEALQRTPSRTSYFIGNDTEEWRTNIPNYERVRFKSVYPGIDLLYYGNQNRLEYDFEVAPGVDPQAIQLRFRGATKVSVDAKGELVIGVNARELRFKKPFLYQQVGETRREVAGGYRVHPGNRVSFRVGPYDRALPLVIDPILEWARYFGGTQEDELNGLDVFTNGDIYVSGYTFSGELATQETLAGVDTSCGISTSCQVSGAGDLFVARFNSAGTSLNMTYIGGDDHEGTDFSGVLKVNAARAEVYLTGYTYSTDFPTVAAIQGTKSDDADAVILRLNLDLATLTSSTYFGGNGADFGDALAIGPTDNIFIGGATTSVNLPDTTPEASTFGGTEDGFIASFTADISTLRYSRYLGGAFEDNIRGIVVDANDRAYVTGMTRSDTWRDGRTVLTGNGGGTFYNGDGWIRSDTNIMGKTVSAVHFGPDGFGWAGTRDAKLYTQDGDWFEFHDFATSEGIASILDTGLPSADNLFVAIGAIVYKRVDFANSFATTFLGIGTVNQLARSAGAVLFAAGETGFARSIDNGANWDVVAGAPALFTSSIAVHPSDGNIVFTSVVDPDNGGVFKSSDAGVTFIPIVSGLPTREILSVAVDPGNPQILYAAAGFFEIYRSANGGNSWVTLETPVPARHVLVDPDFGFVYVGGNLGVAYSFDRGGSWSFDHDPGIVTAFAYEPLSGTVYSGAQVQDAFVAMMNADGTFGAARYFGGSGLDEGNAIAMDGSGNVYVTGATASTNIPATGVQTFLQGLRDIFIAKFDSTLAPQGATYLGGPGQDVGHAIITDSLPSIWVGGTAAANAPLSGDQFQEISAGQRGLYLGRVSDQLSFFYYGTYIAGGSNALNRAAGMVFDSNGDLIVAGSTADADFPVYQAAHTANRTSSSGVVLKFDFGSPSLPAPTLTGVGAVNNEGYVQVAGTDFYPGAQGFLFGSAVPTQFVSPVSLIVSFVEVEAAGGNLSVRNPDGQFSNSIPINPQYGSWNVQFTNPEAAPVASASVDMEVTGSGFTSGMIVTINGQPRTTTFVSSSRLRTRVLSSDLSASGSLNVSVASSNLKAWTTPVKFAVTDFQLALSRKEFDMRAGQAVTLDLDVSPLYGTFPVDVALTCENVPTFMRCQFGTVTVQPGSAGVRTSVRISDAAPAATAQSRPIGWVALWTPLPAVVMLAGWRSRRKRFSALLLVALMAVAMAAGCSGSADWGNVTFTATGQTQAERAPGAYLIKVTGTANGVQHSAQVVVNVY